MLIHTAHLVCRPDVADELHARLARHAATSIEREAGCLQFDVYREAGDPTLFLLHEVYTDHAALEAHRQTEHFRAFRCDTAEWVISRRWWFWSPVFDSSPDGRRT